MSKRHEIAERLRNEGKTFRQIGIELNVSLERARQLVLDARKLREHEWLRRDIPWLTLSTRTRNRIMYYGLSRHGRSPGTDDFPTPQLIRGLVNDGTIHRQLPNFGKVSFQELEDWLRRHGA